MGACLSRNNISDGDFRNLNDSRHVMLLLAKKERQRDRDMRRSISLSGHADADPDASMSVGYHPAERSGASHHTSATTSTTTCTNYMYSSGRNNHHQKSITASVLERCDSGRQRSKRSLMQLASGPHKAPSARQNLINTQKELAKLDSYGEYIPTTAPHSTTTIGEEGPESTAAAAASQQAKAA